MGMDLDKWIGWGSSFVLIVTLYWQLRKQWRSRCVDGISKWLFIGQFAAELGFIAYSYRLRNWVFLFTNVVLLIENVVGLGLVLYARRTQKRVPKTRPIRSDAELA